MAIESKAMYFTGGDGSPAVMAERIAKLQGDAGENVGDELDILVATMFNKNDTDEELIADLDYAIDQLKIYRENAKLSAVYGG